MKTTVISIFALIITLSVSCKGETKVSSLSNTTEKTVEPMGEEAEAAFVRDFYLSEVLNISGEDSLECKCTPELLKELEESNDYDSDGYAVWLFRTCANGNLNEDYRVVSVTPRGNHRFEVKYVDGGIAGCTVVETAVTAEGIKMAAIVKRDKGCEGEGVR